MSSEIQAEQEPVISPPMKRARLFARQPFTSLGKFAFWMFLVGALSGLGGTIALTIGNGAPSRDIVLTMICALICVIVLATRTRWSPLVSTVVGVYNFYLICTEPFVTESLANPKGPNGGYGHFIGDVLIIAISLIGLTASIGMVLQNYRGMSGKHPRWFTVVLCGVLGLAIGASYIGALAQPVSSSASAVLTYTNGVPTVHLTPGNFALSAVTISKGSKLLLVDDTSEQHVLANGIWQQNAPMQQREMGAPLVNSLSLSGNSVAIGPFVTAGTYHILCLLHRGMSLTITVQ